MKNQDQSIVFDYDDICAAANHLPPNWRIVHQTACWITEGTLPTGNSDINDWIRTVSDSALDELTSLEAQCQQGACDSWQVMTRLTAMLLYLELDPKHIHIPAEKLPRLVEQVFIIAELEQLRRSGLIRYEHPPLFTGKKGRIKVREPEANSH